MNPLLLLPTCRAAFPQGANGSGNGPVYDLRTNQHFTQKQNPLGRAHLDEFVASYRSGDPRTSRTESERWKAFPYADLVARDKANLDLMWLRDASLEDADELSAPKVLAREIVDDLEAALAEFAAVAQSLEKAAAARTDRDGLTLRRSRLTGWLSA